VFPPVSIREPGFCKATSMECVSCDKVLSRDGQPPAICGGCSSAVYCGKEHWLLACEHVHLLTLNTGVACQREHWTSHKRVCSALAHDEFGSTFARPPYDMLERILNQPGPSECLLLPKLSAITWTIGLHNVHFASLARRVSLLQLERPAPGDTKEGLIRLLKRAATVIPWSNLSKAAHGNVVTQLSTLTNIVRLGEPEAAVKILARHAEDVEGHAVAPHRLATPHLSLGLCACGGAEG
jgi:hypothetical protein